MSTDIALTNDNGLDIQADLVRRTNQYCSVSADTDEEKAALFNAMSNPSHRLADLINTTIMVKDIFCEVVHLTKKLEDGTEETNAAPRIVLIDDAGGSYQCVSLGIYSAIKNIISLYGPPTWVKPIPLTVRQVTKDKKRMLTLEIEIPHK